MNTKVYSLEELESGLREFVTTAPHQFAIKSALITTLGLLKTLRTEIKTGKAVDSDRFAVTLATVLGEPPRQGSS